MVRNAREIPASTVIMAPFLVAASLQTSESFDLILVSRKYSFCLAVFCCPAFIYILQLGTVFLSGTPLWPTYSFKRGWKLCPIFFIVYNLIFTEYDWFKLITSGGWKCCFVVFVDVPPPHTHTPKKKIQNSFCLVGLSPQSHSALRSNHWNVNCRIPNSKCEMQTSKFSHSHIKDNK